MNLTHTVTGMLSPDYKERFKSEFYQLEIRIKKLKEMLNEEMPYYPLVYKKMGLIGTGTFEAEALPMFNNIYQNIGTWSWTKISNQENQ